MFVALALSMFGLFAFELPSAWVTRATAWTNRAGKGHGYAGAAAMGVISALIVGPCVAAPMAGAVLYIGQAGDAARGSVALFAMGFGMGMPLLALGASSQRLLPRAGPWMDTFQRAAGVVLLAVAAYLLERVVPPAAAMIGWAVVAASACLVFVRAALRRRWRGGGEVWGCPLRAGDRCGRRGGVCRSPRGGRVDRGPRPPSPACRPAFRGRFRDRRAAPSSSPRSRD